MKKSLFTTPSLLVTPLRRVAGTEQLFTRLMLSLSLLVLCTACPSPEAPDDDDNVFVAEVPETVHLAFAGGGWRAHTGHAGWTMSLLDNGSKTLDSVFTNIGAVSSNSGGSWFSTMLMYSDKFVSDIEAKDALSTWGSTGWLGTQQQHFDAASCHLLEGVDFLACVFDKYTGSYSKAARWNLVIEDLIFRDYPLTDYNLLSSRQPWATTKPLLIASTMLTTEVVLNGSKLGNKNFYEACLSPSEPQMNGDKGASCSGGATPDVSPVTFSSVPAGSPYQAPPFFSATGISGSFNLGYTRTEKDAPTATASVSNPISVDRVPVVIAAAASSAAAGFEASKVVSGSKDWVDSYEAEDEALSFQLVNSKANFKDAAGLSVDSLAAQKFVRLADGGPVDNSGVAQLVGFLQQNQQADGFHIVSFNNVQVYYSSATGGADTGLDVAYLFGKGLWNGNQFCSEPQGQGTCVTVPDLQIFNAAPLDSTKATWSVQENTSSVTHELVYTPYTVTTIDNPTFGITEGSTGTLHAFTCIWSDAHTAPQDTVRDGDFKAYNTMLGYINSGLQEKGNAEHTGLYYLRRALGLSQ